MHKDATPSSVHAELERLREALENTQHKASLLESRLRRLQDEEASPKIVEFYDPPAIEKRPSPTRRKALPPPNQKHARALHPTPGLSALTLTKLRLPVIGISMFGCGPETRTRLLQMVIDRMVRRKDFVPVFLIDTADTAEFRRQGVVFEYFPASHGWADKQTWLQRAQAKLDMLKAKYGMTRVVKLGAELPGP